MMTGLVSWRFVSVMDRRGAPSATAATSGGRPSALAKRAQVTVPAVVVRVEVRGRVALPARVRPQPAVRLELLVQQRRHGLVRGGPLGVPAAEDGVGHTA